MQALIDIILPVFLVIGFGYFAVWRGYFPDSGVDGLNAFTQNFAIPTLLFKAIATLDLGQEFDIRLLASFYTGAASGFFIGLFGARYLFGRNWEDSVAIGFIGLFSNSVLLGLPIMERAFGVEALAPNYAIISIHALFCYALGVTAMELVKNKGAGVGAALVSVVKSMARIPLMIGIMLGFVVNLLHIPLPGVFMDAVDMMIVAALPAALFGLGGALVRYKPEGDMRVILFICAVSLIVHPAIVWGMGTWLNLPAPAFRSAVMTAAMAPGVNTYVFSTLYGRAQRVAASSVLIATAATVVTAWLWLSLLNYSG